MTQPSRILNIEEASARLRIPIATMRYWRHKGLGPASFKLGKHVAYLEADIEAFILQQIDNEHHGARASA
jgi:predicted DNA-binding transcriptional regulator AlpA